MENSERTIRVKFLGRGPRTVKLPIPFLSKCEETGEVICNPVGEFTLSDAKALYAVPGITGMFEFLDPLDDELSPEVPVLSESPGIPVKVEVKKRGNPNWKKKVAVATQVAG